MKGWAQVGAWRVRSLLRRSVVDRDLDKELQFHLDERSAELVAEGLSPDEARHIALREFGSTASIAQQCRETRRVNFVQNVVQDLRYASRNVIRQPMLLVTAASSIALGVGANLVIFGLANGLLLSTPTASDPDQLVHIGRSGAATRRFRPGAISESSGVMAGIAGHNIAVDMNWRGGDASISLTPLIVTANFFDVMGIPSRRARVQRERSGGRARSARGRDQPRFLEHAAWRRCGRVSDAAWNGHPTR